MSVARNGIIKLRQSSSNKELDVSVSQARCVEPAPVFTVDWGHNSSNSVYNRFGAPVYGKTNVVFPITFNVTNQDKLSSIDESVTVSSGVASNVSINKSGNVYNVKFSASGTYIIKVKLCSIDGNCNELSHSYTIDTTKTFTAGEDKTITLPVDSVTVTNAEAWYTGQMGSDNIPEIFWTQNSGPNTATITNKDTEKPTFSGLIQGVYEFRMAAKMSGTGEILGSDTMKVFVLAAPVTLYRKGYHEIVSCQGSPTSENREMYVDNESVGVGTKLYTDAAGTQPLVISGVHIAVLDETAIGSDWRSSGGPVGAETPKPIQIHRVIASEVTEVVSCESR